jgi:putative membrane protein
MDNTGDSQANNEVNKVTDLQSDEWHRLSPISIVYFTVQSVLNFANASFYILAAIAINFSKVKENPIISLIVVCCILVFFIVMGILNFWFYRFKVGKARIEIRQGVFKKSHIDLPFERIQNVKLSQPLYYRINDYSCIELETAGSAKQEAKIVALKTNLAEKFRLKILESSAQEQGDEQASSLDDKQTKFSDEVVLNRRSMQDLIIHGITNNRVWIFLGALAPFYNSISEVVSEIFISIGFDVEYYFSLETQAWWELGLHILSVVMVVMLLVVMLSVAGAILMFYNYTLSKTNDRYIRRSGLLTKHEVSMKLSRIQIMVQAQDWLDVLLGRVNLSFEQNTSGAANPNKSGEQMSNKLLVPSVTLNESRQLMNDAMPSQRLSEQNFKAISKRYIFRGILLLALPLSVLPLAFLFQDNLLAALILASLIFGLITVAYCISWKRWGYNYDNEYIYIRSGFFGVNYYCFPIYKVQQAQFKQSAFIKPYNLATLKVVLASGAKRIPYMPATEVRSLIDAMLDKLVVDKRSWM